MEAIGLIAVSTAVAEDDRVLGQFLFWGTIAVLFKARMDGQIIRRRLRQLRDGEIELRTLVDMYQNR